MKYALVQFKEKGRSVKYLVLTKDIAGYEPSNAKDFCNREYMVKWQQSFDGLDGVKDNGCYPATILLLGASKDELRLKAKEHKIRNLPGSLAPPPNTNKSSDPMAQPLRKSHQRRSEEAAARKSKAKRMEKTLLLVGGDKLSENGGAGAKISQSDGSLAPSPVKNKSSDTMAKPLRKSHQKQTEQSREKISKTKGSKQTLLLLGEDQVSDNGGASAETSQSDSISDSVNQDMRPMVDSELEPVPFDNGPGLERSSKTGCESSLLRSDDLTTNTVKGRGLRAIKRPSYEIESADSSEDDATVQLDKLIKEHNFCSPKIERLQEKIVKLEEGLKIYKVEMAKKRNTINKLKEEIQEFKDLNMSLQHQLQLYRKPALERKVKLDEASFRGDNTSSLFFKSSSPNDKSYSPLGAVSPMIAGDSTSPWKNDEGIMGRKDHPIKKKLFSESDEFSEEESAASPLMEGSDGKKYELHTPRSLSMTKAEGNNDTDDETISRRVAEDLQGKRNLRVKGDKVYIGKNIYVNKEYWEKKVRLERDDSKFIKDCAQGVWGTEALKVRRVEKASNGKVKATPAKVDAVCAMLRGKLKARGASKTEETHILKSAKHWLGEKMYDSGRPPKKRTKFNN